MEDNFHLGIKALIRNKRGEILLLKINPEDFSTKVTVHWDLPGGRIHQGETVEQALRREVKEEIGLPHITIGELLDASISNMRITHLNRGLILFTYLCSTDTDNIRITDNEHTEFKWVNPKKAAELLAFKFSKSLTDKIIKL